MNFAIHSTDGKMFENLDLNVRNQLKYKVYRYDQEVKPKKAKYK